MRERVLGERRTDRSPARHLLILPPPPARGRLSLRSFYRSHSLHTRALLPYLVLLLGGGREGRGRGLDEGRRVRWQGGRVCLVRLHRADQDGGRVGGQDGDGQARGQLRGKGGQASGGLGVGQRGDGQADRGGSDEGASHF